MGISYFWLGDVYLNWVPEAITYGGGRHITRHNLLGGGRVYDVMGTDPEDVVISGKLAGATKFDDRDALKAMEGTTQTLSWGSDSLDVIVLKASFQQEWDHIAYTITCGVLVQPSLSTTPTAAQAAANSVAQANALAVPASVAAPLANASAVLSNSSVAPSSALPDLASAANAATTAVSSADSTISTFNPSTASGITRAQFVKGMTAWSSALQARAQAAEINDLIHIAINSITKSGN